MAAGKGGGHLEGGGNHEKVNLTGAHKDVADGARTEAYAPAGDKTVSDPQRRAVFAQTDEKRAVDLNGRLDRMDSQEYRQAAATVVTQMKELGYS